MDWSGHRLVCQSAYFEGIDSSYLHAMLREITVLLYFYSCYIKGIATFVTNLFRSGLTVTKWQSSRHTEWMLQYYHGMRQGIFPVILPPSFSERLVFEKVSEQPVAEVVGTAERK